MRSSVIRSGALTGHHNSNERPPSPLDLDHSSRHCAHSIPGSIGEASVGGSVQSLGVCRGVLTNQVRAPFAGASNDDVHLRNWQRQAPLREAQVAQPTHFMVIRCALWRKLHRAHGEFEPIVLDDEATNVGMGSGDYTVCET